MRALRRRRRWPPARRRDQPVRGAKGLILSAFIGVGLGLLFVAWLNRRMTPMLLPLAEAQVDRRVTAAVTWQVESALAAGGMDYSDMVTAQTAPDGHIVSLTSNAAAMNALRTRVLSGVLADLDALSQETIPIPAGNLTGWDILSGAGPTIQVGVQTAGAAGGDFRGTFTSAGVNQTRHQITLEVWVRVTLLLPSGPVERTVTCQVPVAETVIVGEVPQQYVSIGTELP